MHTIGWLLLVILAAPLAAQADTAGRPPALAPLPEPHVHPILDRSEWLTPRTIVAGLLIGTAVGWTQSTPHPRTGAVVGVGLGVFAGALGGTAIRFRAPSFDARRYGRSRDIGRYMGFGAQLGLGSGILVALQRESNGLYFLLNQHQQVLISAGGLLIGAAMGFVSYFIQH